MPLEPPVALLIGGPCDGKTIPLPEHWSHRILVDPLMPMLIGEYDPEPSWAPREIHIYEWSRYPAGWPKTKYTPFLHTGKES